MKPFITRSTLVTFAAFLAALGIARGEDGKSAPTDGAVPPPAQSVVSDESPVIAKKPTPAPKPAAQVVAVDHSNDKGDKIDVNWESSPDDDSTARVVTGYLVERSADDGANWLTIDTATPLVDPAKRTKKYVDSKQLRADKSYRYRITAVGPGGSSPSVSSTGSVEAKLQYFDLTKVWFGIILGVLCAVVIAYIFIARSGRDLKIRKIAGLEVVDEAVGRATEMGKSCIFVPGIEDMNNIQTVAAITVLARVAKTAAEYDARVEAPTSKSLVMTAAREAMQSAYLRAGRPDAYNEEDVYYVTDEQFGYVAFLAGKMVREKPAACFYMGAFYAESLILAETGNSINAIQVAGTAQPAQLPFFVAACDYTLIGEEFFAASAYLSGEPDQLGSLKGQDIGKLIAVALILIGCLLAAFDSATGGAEAWANRLDFFKEDVLNARGGK